MREYIIEYTDCSLLAKYCFIVGGCGLAAMVSMMALSPNETIFTWTALVGLVMLLTYLLVSPSKIRKNGVIMISRDRIVFGVASGIRIIDMDKLAKCEVTRYDGAQLTLVLKNGRKFRIVASNNFCDTSRLEQACHDIQTALQQNILVREDTESERLNKVFSRTKDMNQYI